jgi:hypothetical protein
VPKVDCLACSRAETKAVKTAAWRVGQKVGNWVVLTAAPMVAKWVVLRAEHWVVLTAGC